MGAKHRCIRKYWHAWYRQLKDKQRRLERRLQAEEGKAQEQQKAAADAAGAARKHQSCMSLLSKQLADAQHALRYPASVSWPDDKQRPEWPVIEPQRLIACQCSASKWQMHSRLLGSIHWQITRPDEALQSTMKRSLTER